MKGLISVLIAVLCALAAGAAGAAASCCMPGSEGQSNFLGDSEANIVMQGHDEFLAECPVPGSFQNLPAGSKSRMSLDLNDTRSVYLILSRKEANLTGEGSMKGFNGTETLLAAGTVRGNAVALDINASSGGWLEFRLAAEGSRVTGEFNETAADGKIVQGAAEGRWMSE